MKSILVILCATLALFAWKWPQPTAEIIVDKVEAKKAFEYLNLIRENPGKHSEETGVKLGNVKSIFPLKWNDTLARVAEEKAMDMAKRNYFSHTTPDGNGINIMIYNAGYKLDDEWIKNKKENYFESIQAGAKDGIESIKLLIVDGYDKNLGHRKHLLGMGEWNAGLKDVGIGFVRSPQNKYKAYTSIIIAKHGW